jgi:methyltransferase (TIGR00027 family)
MCSVELPVMSSILDAAAQRNLAIDGGVGRTCLLIAAWRAMESEQIDPLFVDPIANIFLTAELEAWVDEVTLRSVSTRRLIGFRTRYFDDRLKAEMDRGVRQVVLLGAGLDTRAIRMGRPSVTFFEVDQAEVLAYKRQRLERHGYAANSRFVVGDYVREDLIPLLHGEGFRSEEETYFIWEGNTMYLTQSEIRALLDKLKAGVPRFRISFDYLSEELVQGSTGFRGAKELVSGFEEMGAPWVSGFSDLQQLAARTRLEIIENRKMVNTGEGLPFQPRLDPELFRHYFVSTLSSHE